MASSFKASLVIPRSQRRRGIPLDETDLTGATTNAAFKEYVFFGGKRIARRDSTNAVNYYFSDHLGTARVVANSSGTVLDDSDFYPFGGERIVTSSSGNAYKFTGKERDAESNLDNFGARYDSSSFGRFMSPDPSMDSVKLGNPQSWNRYAYTINNPLRFIDPDGELWVASGIANNPYTWVDECEEPQVCYESVAAAIGYTLRIYGSDNSGDITNIQANENGMVDLNDINQQHDAAFDVNSKTQYSYVDVRMAANFFNFVQDYQINYPNDAPNLYVTEAGSEDGSKVPGHYTHRDGLQIDLRYADDKGRNIWGPEAYNKADADRMWDTFRMAHNNGMTQIYAGDESEWGDFAKRPAPPYDPHESHFHLSIPNTRPPRN
jgi:RHS repeat-associated protein